MVTQWWLGVKGILNVQPVSLCTLESPMPMQQIMAFKPASVLKHDANAADCFIDLDCFTSKRQNLCSSKKWICISSKIINVSLYIPQRKQAKRKSETHLQAVDKLQTSSSMDELYTEGFRVFSIKQ